MSTTTQRQASKKRGLAAERRFWERFEKEMIDAATQFIRGGKPASARCVLASLEYVLENNPGALGETS